jgi:hypothetical protein
LDNGLNDLESKSVYKLNGERPTRDYMAERYLKEVEMQEVISEKNSEAALDDSEFDIQQSKFKKMQEKQKRDM